MGESRYFTGKPCAHGHVAERYVSTMQCMVCVKKYAKQWAIEHPAMAPLIRKTYRANHPEKFKAWKSESQKRNRESANIRNRRWVEAHRSQVRQINKAWAEANPAKSLAKARRYQADVLQRMPAWADKSAIEIVYQAAEIARKTWPETQIHVDHVVPLRGKSVSGLHVHQNLQITTAIHNQRKSNHFQGAQS